MNPCERLDLAASLIRKALARGPHSRKQLLAELEDVRPPRVAPHDWNYEVRCALTDLVATNQVTLREERTPPRPRMETVRRIYSLR